jgi:hypothetical protein
MSVSCECCVCQVEVSATGWSLVQKNPTECGLSKVWSWSLEEKRRPRPPRGCRAIGKKRDELMRCTGPCHGSGGYSWASHGGGPVSIPGQSIVVDKVALGQVFPRVLRFSPVNFIPPVLHYLEKIKKKLNSIFIFVFITGLHNKP